MSGQGPQTTHKVRRNVSPSQTQRQGPIKAVKPFGINLRNSPSRSPSSPSHVLFTQQGPRRSPVAESRHSPDRRSPGPGSPSKVEKPRPVRISPSTSQLRRTSSLDTITGPYLKGHWPVDVSTTHQSQPSVQSYVRDETTQTPDEWPNPPVEDMSRSEKKKKKHRRSASFGHADKKFNNLNNIRQKLQKTKDQSSKQRSSPIPGNHNALLQTAPAVLMRSNAIPIPNVTAHIPRSSMTRYQRNSVEGLSMEIKGLMMRDAVGAEEEVERPIEIPDGHRAPVPEVTTRSRVTQTPSGNISDQGSNSPASPAIRPFSTSPASYPMILGQFESSPRPSSYQDSPGSTPRDKLDKETDDSDGISPDGLKKTASPKPNQIVREPPDGCEKAIVVDEDRNRRPSIKEPLFISPIPTQNFELKPSTGSAFYPLKKLYKSQGSGYKQSSPVTVTILESQSALTTS